MNATVPVTVRLLVAMGDQEPEEIGTAEIQIPILAKKVGNVVELKMDRKGVDLALAQMLRDTLDTIEVGIPINRPPAVGNEGEQSGPSDSGDPDDPGEG